MKSIILRNINIDKKKIISELWSQFIASVEEYYWDKYSESPVSTKNFKNDFVSSKFSSDFAYEFQKQVEIHLKYLSENKIPYPYTGRNNKTSINGSSLLTNFFRIGGFSDEVKDSTLNLFCLYLGYDSYGDFMKKNQIKLYPKVLRFYLLHPDLSHFLGVILLGLSSLYCYLKTGVPTDEQIKEFIITANKVEYEAYKKVPKFDTTEIDKFWTKDGISRKRIVNILIKHPQKGLILIDTLRASGAKLLNFKVILKSRYYIRLETEEHWRLLWFNTKTNEFNPIYDRVDNQVYELKRENSKWKINDNWHIKKPDEISIN